MNSSSTKQVSNLDFSSLTGEVQRVLTEINFERTTALMPMPFSCSVLLTETEHDLGDFIASVSFIKKLGF